MISNTARFLLDPFHIFLFLLGAGAIFYYVKKKRVSNAFFTAGAIWLLLITTPYLPYAVLNSLEKQYDPVVIENLDFPNDQYHIIVLGAGYSYNERFLQTHNWT